MICVRQGPNMGNDGSFDCEFHRFSQGNKHYQFSIFSEIFCLLRVWKNIQNSQQRYTSRLLMSWKSTNAAVFQIMHSLGRGGGWTLRHCYKIKATNKKKHKPAVLPSSLLPPSQTVKCSELNQWKNPSIKTSKNNCGDTNCQKNINYVDEITFMQLKKRQSRTQP